MQIYNEEERTRSIRFNTSLNEKIEKLAKENQRDFSKQVRFMLEEYLRLKEQK